MLKILCSLLMLFFPLIMIIFSAITKKAADKDYSHSFGFITASARQNQETWNFANKLASVIFKVVGIFLLVVSIIISIFLFVFFSSADIIFDIFAFIISAETIIFIACIFAVVISIYKNFGNISEEKENKK